MKIRKGLRIAIPMAVVALGLVMASVAWACSAYNGQTFIQNPTTLDWSTYSKVSVSRRAGASIKIRGDGVALGDAGYGTKDGDAYQPVMSGEGDCCIGGTKLGGTVPLEHTKSPDIRETAVQIPAGTSGNKWICMLNEGTVGIDDSTAHATLSIL